MNIKYDFLVFSTNDKLISKSFVTNSLSYNTLLTYLYNNFRNFHKLYFNNVNTSNVDKYVLDSIIDLFNIDNYKKIDNEYFVYICIEDNIANITIEKDEYICAYKKVIINDKYSGNCITDFIKRGIDPLIEEIKKYYDNILDRNQIRINTNQYNDSICYEQDYGQILKIKKLAEKISLLCNDELQHLSDIKKI